MRKLGYFNKDAEISGKISKSSRTKKCLQILFVKSCGRRKDILIGAANWFDVSPQRAIVGCYIESSDLECLINERIT
jgi:hypothetical protein